MLGTWCRISKGESSINAGSTWALETLESCVFEGLTSWRMSFSLAGLIAR